MPKGQLYIVSGPSGSGKDTVLCEFFKIHPDIKLSISSVTRGMRKGEVEGQKYHFITKEEFMEKLRDGKFLEHNEYMGNFYGTPKEPVEQCIETGGDIILEVDVNGAESVKRLMAEAVSIFIMPPSFEVLKSRLSGRGTETAEVICGRLQSAITEIERAEEYDYIVVNGNLDRAVSELSAIITSERCRRARKKYIIDEVLNNVESCDW